jgi:uncharacterized ParB-like nuclease family protein
VKELKVADIRRPLARTRTNDSAKVEALMESIQQHGLKVPIDVLEVSGLTPRPYMPSSSIADIHVEDADLQVDGKIYGFSGAQTLMSEWCMCNVENDAYRTVLNLLAGCHRFEAFQRLGKERIPCRVRKATIKTLQMHLM